MVATTTSLANVTSEISKELQIQVVVQRHPNYRYDYCMREHCLGQPSGVDTSIVILHFSGRQCPFIFSQYHSHSTSSVFKYTGF
jgi:hypothetical protein